MASFLKSSKLNITATPSAPFTVYRRYLHLPPPASTRTGCQVATSEIRAPSASKTQTAVRGKYCLLPLIASYLQTPFLHHPRAFNFKPLPAFDTAPEALKFKAEDLGEQFRGCVSAKWLAKLLIVLYSYCRISAPLCAPSPLCMYFAVFPEGKVEINKKCKTKTRKQKKIIPWFWAMWQSEMEEGKG